MKERNQTLSPTQILQITNILRIIGLKTSHIGTKLINKSIQYIIINDMDFFTLEEIYNYLHSIYNFNKRTIKSNMNNAITNRDIKKSKDNFEKVFHYEYDVYTFEPKTFLEEISQIIYTNLQ